MTSVHPDSDIISHATGLSVSARPLTAIHWLRHASTTREFSSPDSPRLEDLKRIRKHLTVPSSFLAYAEQKHTSNIGIVTENVFAAHKNDNLYQFPQTDALVTALPNVTLAIMTADCAPVFIVDPVHRIIGLAHAGWKGTLARIAEHTVLSMEKLGSKPRDLIAWVGPMAGGCCYEVSDELVEKFTTEFAEWSPTSIHHGRHLDLVAVNCLQLEHAGLLPNNLHRSNLCTIHQSDQFYSYRADNGTHGRIISAMAMVAA